MLEEPSTTVTEAPPKVRWLVWRILLGVAGFNVGVFWLGLGLLPVIDIWGKSFINLGLISWVPTLGGIVMFVWTCLGVVKPTPLRFFPPALVSFPIALIGVSWMVEGYVGRFT
jgi:hypothetical protein